MHKNTRSAALRTAVSAAVAALSALPVAAQTAPAEGAEAEPQRITITGSNIKRVDAEGVLPIQVITAEEIKRTGFTVLTDVLRNLSLAGSYGLSDISGAGSFSTGASSVSLRSLGSQATLLLLNGRRIAPFAAADPNYGQASVVNLDTLPLEVIERVEILKAGASAIYGSDAIAGVINVITKREFTGGLIDVTASQNTRGNYPSQGLSLTYGLGDLAADNYNVFTTIELNRRERTGFRDEESWLIDKRFRESPFYFTGIPRSSYSSNYYAAVFDPATFGSAFYYANLGATEDCPEERIDANGVCRFDNYPYFDLSSPSDRLNLLTVGTFSLSPSTTLFAELGYNQTKTTFLSPPQVWGDFGSWYAAGTGEIVNVPEVLPPGHPNNPTGDYIGLRHRFEEIGPRKNIVDLSALRLVAGVRGTWADWDYESALTYSQNRFKSTNLNEVSRTALTEGILNGTYNFFDPFAGALTPDDLRLSSVDTAKSSYAMIDLKGARELMKLGGGPLTVAVGTEYRRESRSATPDANKLNGEVLGYGAASADGTRNVATAFAELSLPFIKDLDVQFAARMDRYSDYGTSTNPKVGASYKVAPNFLVRGSYETGFRAPSLTEIADSDVSAFTFVVDQARCITGNEDECFGVGVGLLVQANPDLKPEKSRGLNFGVVWEPVQNVSVSVDYFNIERRNEVGILSLDEIIANEGSSDPRYAGRVTRGPADPNNPGVPGPIQVVSTGYYNLGRTETSGIDIDAQWRFGLGDLGRLDVGVQATHTLTFRQQFSEGSPLVDYIGYFSQPRSRGNVSVGWEYGGFNVGVAANLVSGYKVYNPPEVDPDGCDNPFYVGLCKVPSSATYDLSVGYDGFKDLRLLAVVSNITDRRPPIDPNFYSTPAYNYDFHNGRGRVFTLSAQYKF